MVQLTPELTALIELLESIADNKFVLGDRLVEIGLGAPDIESATSAIAMAQGELGHARILYNWVSEIAGRTKQDVKEQTGHAFESVEQTNSWISLIATLYTVDISQDLVLRNLLEQRRSEVATKIHKLFKEQKEHILYSKGWALELLNDEGAIPRTFKEALNKVIPEAEKWLLQVENSLPLVKAGYIAKDSNLVGQFKEQLASLLGNEVTSYVN